MKIRKHILLAGLILAAVCLLGGCAKTSTGSGIVQRRMGSGKTAAQQTGQTEAEDTEVPSAAEETDLYIITKIDEAAKEAVFQRVSDGRQLQYTYDIGTRFLDKYGDTKSAASFLPGDVATIEVTKSTQQLTCVQLSDEVWVYEDIVNYTIDESIHAVTIGQTKYSYDPDMDIFSGDAKVGFASVGGSDVLRAVGLGKKLLSLAVAKGHGFLALANTKLFEGSFICIGEKIFEQVTPNMQIEVPEGKYLVTVANNGYGGSREIQVERDKTTSLNLDELKGEGPKVCRITFEVGIDGAVLWIDGKKADYSKPVELAYGVHTISVEAEGYETITERLVVNSKEAEIEIALNASSGSKTSDKDKKSKETKDKGDNASSSAGTNGNQNNNTNNNSSNNNNNNNNNGTDNGQTDYLTTLYNLLTSINNNNTNGGTGSTNQNSNTNSNNNSNQDRSYDDLRDE